MAKSTGSETTVFSPYLDTVIDAEKSYLKKRRRKNGLSKPEDDDLWGLSISGGGIRSATFGLGVLQRLISKNVLKRFDYLSTVSGGGYIGSCLTSLLTEQPDKKADDPCKKTGLEKYNSPFAELGGDEIYTLPKFTRLNAKHQIHHLRTHGEYLIPQKRLFSRDVLQAFGSILTGITYTLFFFLCCAVLFVAGLHLLVTVFFDPNLAHLFVEQSLELTSTGFAYIEESLTVWVATFVTPPIKAIVSSGKDQYIALVVMALAGLFWSGVVTHFYPDRWKKKIEVHPEDLSDTFRSGWNAEEYYENLFFWRFMGCSIAFALCMTLSIAGFQIYGMGKPACMAGFLFPLAFAIGGAVSILGITLFYPSRRHRQFKSTSRIRRSFYGGLQGACFYGFFASILGPLLIIALFALSHLPFKFFTSLISLTIAYLLARSGKKGDNKIISLLQRFKISMLNFAIAVFLVLFLSEISGWLFKVYAKYNFENVWMVSGTVLIISTLIFIGIGFFIDPNRISPHYFYRDRLTEAYLRTDGRTNRPDGSNRQGMPMINIRNHEKLCLKDLGRSNGRGPYHLIVAALNLRGSKELKRKTFLSDHFIFSKKYVGSSVTGYTLTKKYHSGEVKLARAMTISAAAVGSAAGYQSFWGQAFMATLFNTRLGYWMENPFYYDPNRRHPKKHFTFWPYYLATEMMGQTTARERLVNLSDGGHTGDNLGLMPLLHRRCQTIVVVDGEADEKLGFESFNNAIRMAFIEENIRIEIDLSSIMARNETKMGYMLSETSMAKGKIYYPQQEPSKSKLVGDLYYIKSSVSGNLPASIENYLKRHESFPHQSTTDQFFDDAQFEAYRALGYLNAGNAAKILLKKV